MIRDRALLALRAAPAGFRAIVSRATTEVGISSGSIQFTVVIPVTHAENLHSRNAIAPRRRAPDQGREFAVDGATLAGTPRLAGLDLLCGA
jgi:hypothetical protein